jgi:hypothetical protein
MATSDFDVLLADWEFDELRDLDALGDTEMTTVAAPGVPA